MLQIYQDFHAGVERPARPGALHWKLSSWPSLSSNDVDAHLYVYAPHLGQKIQLIIVKIIQEFLTQFDPSNFDFYAFVYFRPKIWQENIFSVLQIHNQGWLWKMFNWQLTDFYPDEKDDHVIALTRTQVGLEGKNGAGYNKWGGVCLMTQNYRLIINIIVSYQLS